MAVSSSYGCLVHLRFERVQTRQQRQDEEVLLLVRESGKVGAGGFFAMTAMMDWFGLVYN
jgi:hypothetical protein